MRFFTTTLLLLTLLATSCTKNNRFAIDTEKSSLEIKINRFDQDFFALDTLNITAGIPSLQEKYPAFFPFYTENILEIGTPDSLDFYEKTRQFLTIPYLRAAYAEGERQFADVSDIEAKLTVAFRYLQHYFPKMSVPKIYMHASGFNAGIVAAPEILSLSIDQYLGADYIAYSEMQIYAYLRDNMRREKVASDLVRGWIATEFEPEPSDVLLENMLHWGRLMFLLETIMPDESEALLMGYATEQLDFVKKNEKSIWAAFLNGGSQRDRLLFSNDRMNIVRYINPAPFSLGMPETDQMQTPGQVGIWIGWQIVRQYMDKNTEITLPGLMQETNYQKILEGSKYRP
jgi:hypothetical protein